MAKIPTAREISSSLGGPSRVQVANPADHQRLIDEQLDRLRKAERAERNAKGLIAQRKRMIRNSKNPLALASNPGPRLQDLNARIERLQGFAKQDRAFAKQAESGRTRALTPEERITALRPEQLQRLQNIQQATNPALQRFKQAQQNFAGSAINRQQRQIALGNAPTTAEIVGRAQQQQLGQQIAANAAASGALNNPAVARAALQQQSGLGQAAALSTQGAASAERSGIQEQQLGRAIQQQQLGLDADNAGFQQRLGQQALLDQIRGGANQERQQIFENTLAPHNLQNQQPKEKSGFQKGLDIFGQITGGVGGLIGGIGSFATGGAAKSDIRAKEKIKGGEKDISNFLDKLSPFGYEYKKSEKDSPFAGKGKHVSVMAQDLEKAGPIGKRMVINTPEGKLVNYSAGLPAMLAALADTHKRLKKVEK